LKPGFIDGEYQDGELRGLTFIAGLRGMGKTTEAIRLVEQCRGTVIFFDTVGRHVALLPGFIQVSQPGELKDLFMAAGHNRRKPVRAIYVPKDEFPEEHMQAVAVIVRAMGQMIFCVDEIDTFCGAEYGAKQMPDELYNLAHFGRHYRVSMLATARDPASLSIRFRSQCAFMRLFRTDEGRYVKYFEARIGKVNAAKLPTLRKTYFLLWESGKTEASVCGGPRKL